MARKEEIIESVEYIFENTKRIHGNSEALDWQKIAIHKSVDYILSLPIDVPNEEEIKANLPPQTMLDNDDYSNGERSGFLSGADYVIKEVIERNKK